MCWPIWQILMSQKKTLEEFMPTKICHGFLFSIFRIHAVLLNNIFRAKIKRSFDCIIMSIFPNSITPSCACMCSIYIVNNVSMLQRLHFLNVVENRFKMQTKVDSRSVNKICESMCFLIERYILLISTYNKRYYSN